MEETKKKSSTLENQLPIKQRFFDGSYTLMDGTIVIPGQNETDTNGNHEAVKPINTAIVPFKYNEALQEKKRIALSKGTTKQSIEKNIAFLKAVHIKLAQEYLAINDYLKISERYLENRGTSRQKDDYVTFVDSKNTRDISHSRFSALSDIHNSPYFGVLETSDNAYYIGKQGYHKGNIEIYDWRSPIYAAYQKKNIHKITLTGIDERITSKAQVQTKDCILMSYYESYRALIKEESGPQKANDSFIGDPFLLSVLNDKGRVGAVRDIIETIQQKQYEIIEVPETDNIIVQGCAGSGKSMIMLHRLSYLIFNKRLTAEDALIIVPSNLFKVALAPVLKTLELDKVEVQDFASFLDKLAKDYAVDKSYMKHYMEDHYGDLNLINFNKKVREVIVNHTKAILAPLKLGKIKTPLKTLQMMTPNYATTIDRHQKEIKDFRQALSTYIEVTQGRIKAQSIRHDELSLLTDQQTNTLEALQTELKTTQKNLDHHQEQSQANHTEAMQDYGVYYEPATEDEIDPLAESLRLFYTSAVERLKAQLEKTREELDNTQKIVANLAKNIILMQENLTKAKDTLATLETGDYDPEALSDAGRLIRYKMSMDQGMDANTGGRAAVGIDFTQNIKTSRFMEETIAMYQNLKTAVSQLENLGADLVEMYGDQVKIHPGLSFYILLLTKMYLVGPNQRMAYIFLDEAQEHTILDLQLLKTAALRPKQVVFNLFGDYHQSFKQNTKDAWKDFAQFIHGNQYTLNENYRNSLQIAEFYNKLLGKQDRAIGIKGEPVMHLKSSNTGAIQALVQKYLKTHERIALITKKALHTNPKAMAHIRHIVGCTSDAFNLNPNHIEKYKLNAVPVLSSKGMEYECCIVFLEGMTPAEKYVALTRGIRSLLVIDG